MILKVSIQPKQEKGLRALKESNKEEHADGFNPAEAREGFKRSR